MADLTEELSAIKSDINACVAAWAAETASDKLTCHLQKLRTADDRLKQMSK